MGQAGAKPLKNQRQERFAQEVAKGKTADDAYAHAGYLPNRHNASRLKTNEHVAARIAYLQGKVAEKAVTTAADIIDQLAEDRRFARELKSPAAAVSATMGQAKVLGLLKERVEHTGKDGAAIEVDSVSVETRSRFDKARRIAHLLRVGQKRLDPSA